MQIINDFKLWFRSPHLTTWKIQSVRWNCGKKSDLGINEVHEFQDWSERETTPDQKRIEAFLSTISLSGKSLLHIGIGNSELAKTFHLDLKSIDGVTIENNEFEKGQDLGIDNYRVFLLNKFSNKMPYILGKKYDFIIDNNPSTFACCRKHFYTMMESYRTLLRPGGVILTDELGLEWYTSPNNPIWGLTKEVWFEIGSKFKFEGVSYNDWVFGLKKRT